MAGVQGGYGVTLYRHIPWPIRLRARGPVGSQEKLRRRVNNPVADLWAKGCGLGSGMAKPSKSQRRSSPQVASATAVRREPMRLRTAVRRKPLRLRKAEKPVPVRLRTKVFWIVSAGMYVASILVPAIMGLWVWMQVDIIVVPFLALIAQAVTLGDQTPDGSILTIDVNNSWGDCNSGGDC